MLDVTCAPPQRHGSLTIFPLIATRPPELAFTLMIDALGSGALKITELGSGTVPELLATNAGDADILVLDGEQLIGAKQNRTTNRSLILPARSETRLPVSCMEHGRWGHTSSNPDFAPAPHSSPSSVRRHAREAEARYADQAQPAPISALASAQGQVWSTIAVHSASLGAHSATGALDAVYTARDSDIGAWLGDFPILASQIGLLALLGDDPLGVDVIGCTRLYGRLHERIVRGYIVDSLATPRRSAQPGEERAQLYLSRINAARRVPSPTVGAGEYAVLSGSVVGGELTDVGELVHLSAFPAEVPPSAPGRLSEPPLPPPSRRRRL